MLSVNTNYSAMIALQNLNFTNTELEGVQNKISTGLKIASARDDGAIYAIAEGQRSRVSSVAAVKDGIDRANSTLDVALAAGKSIGDILQKLKAKAVAAQADDLTPDQRAALQADFASMRSQIDVIANSAQFNGANLAVGSFKPQRSDLRPRRFGCGDHSGCPIRGVGFAAVRLCAGHRRVGHRR
ncbi:MAG: flagellin [Hyphomonadaceae bacterium]